MGKIQQTYRYIKRNSILGDLHDDYHLSQEEFYKIYNFYVAYSMCGSQSAKKRSFIDYGWETNTIKNSELGNALAKVVNFRNSNFAFTENDDLRTQFTIHNHLDPRGELINVDTERAVIAYTGEDNKYLKLFYRIRDGFAHGKYCLREASNGEKMVIIQDDNGKNVTARIVIKLSTLLRFVEVIDINNLISC